LAKQFQRRRFLEINPPETRIAYHNHVFFMVQEKMSNLYRESSINASYQVSVHLASSFRRTFLETDQPETRIAYGSLVCYWIMMK